MTFATIAADWSAPKHVTAFTTTTAGGVSEGSYATLNLGNHVCDNPAHVAENRQRLQRHIGEDIQLCWLQQTHSDRIIDTANYRNVVEADAAVSSIGQHACIVMTADCLPVLLCNVQGTRVAALHCGWKGLQYNLIQKTISQHFVGEQVIAWLGPAIGQQSYEVNDVLYQHFVACDKDYATAFYANRTGHYLMSLTTIARQQLIRAGIDDTQIFGGHWDTFSDTRFFSHRRNSHSGRIASLIYLNPLNT